MKYKRKSSVVEAFQYDGDLKGNNGSCVPEWVIKAHEDHTLFYSGLRLRLRQPHTILHVQIEDYIKLENGEISLVRKEIFEEMYEQII